LPFYPPKTKAIAIALPVVAKEGLSNKSLYEPVVDTVAKLSHEAVVPLVVKYLPELPV
jgi:hypothetical protein